MVPNRVKQYPEGAKGPYFVFVRKKEKDIDPLKIQKMVFKAYKSCVKAFSVNVNKMKFELSDLKEANDMVYDLNLVIDYKFYVLTDTVEVRRVINLASTAKLANFCNIGVNIKKVKVLEVYRSVVTGTNDSLNKVKVTFEGSALPDFIIMDEHLIIRVRPFYPKPMFCEKCLGYSHTTPFCTQYRQKCRKCGENHSLEDCTSIISKCFHCNGDHLTGSPECITRKRVEKKVQNENKLKLYNSYQALLTHDDKNDEEEKSEEEDEISIERTNQFGKRKQPNTLRLPPTKRNVNTFAEIVSQNNIPVSSSKSAQSINSRVTSSSNRRLTQKQPRNEKGHSTVFNLVEDIINKTELPNFIKDLLLKLLPPIIDSLWCQISESLTNSITTNI